MDSCGNKSQKSNAINQNEEINEERIIAKKFLFGDNRERNIIRASITALNMMRKELMM